MAVIIAGSRHLYVSQEFIAEALQKFSIFGHPYRPSLIVSGGAGGVDRCGEIYARQNGIALRVMPAEWWKHGKSAGPIRNQEMVNFADALLLIWTGESRGSANILEIAKKKTYMMIVEKRVTEEDMKRWRKIKIVRR